MYIPEKIFMQARLLENILEWTITINISRTKKMSNMRASGSDEKTSIAPAIKFSLEEAMEYIGEDEYVEVTPKSIRLRKILISEHDRKKKKNQGVIR